MTGMPVLLFLDISGGELLLIAVVVFLVFGPEKMPEMARKFGKAMNQMKKASNDLTREFTRETSGLRNEINNISQKVTNEVDQVNREINKTKAEVTKNLAIEDSTPISDDKFEATYPNENSKGSGAPETSKE